MRVADPVGRQLLSPRRSSTSAMAALAAPLDGLEGAKPVIPLYQLEVMMSLTAFLPSPPSPVRGPHGPFAQPLVPASVTATLPSAESLRKQIAAAANLVVVKVGTRV